MNADPIRESLRPVFEALGAAVFDAQRFERAVARLIALADEAAAAEVQGNIPVQAAGSRARKRTLGELLSMLDKRVPLLEHDRSSVRLALDLRNDLIHQWLHRNVSRLMTPDGIEEAVSRLNAASQAFNIVCERINQYIDDFLVKYHLSTESLKLRAERKWETLNVESIDDLPTLRH